MSSAPRTKAYLCLLATAVIWGAAGPIIKFTTDFLPPLIFLTYRFFISSLIALFFLPSLRRHLPKSPSAWMKVFLYGFLVSTVTLSLLFFGAAYSSSLVLAVAGSIDPVIAATAGLIFLHEHVTLREKTGISVALAGSLLVTLEPIFKSGLVSGTLLGNLLLLASRFTDVASSIISKSLLRLRVSPHALTHLAFITGFFTILPLTLFTYSPTLILHSLAAAPLSAHLGVFYMAVMSGTLAYTLWHQAEKTIEVGEAALSYYLQPIFAIPLSIFWLHETISPIFLLGCVVIAAGVVLAGYRRSLKKH